MAQTLGDTLAGIEMHNRRIVEAQTFGHLAPKQYTEYPIEVVFSKTEHDDLAIIRSKHPTLDDSPWLYEDMQTLCDERGKVQGAVYKFTGTYRKCNSGRAVWKGKVKRIWI